MVEWLGNWWVIPYGVTGFLWYCFFGTRGYDDTVESRIGTIAAVGLIAAAAWPVTLPGFAGYEIFLRLSRPKPAPPPPPEPARVADSSTYRESR